MTGTEILGQFAGAFVTFSIIPQLIRVFKLKSAREISMLFSSALLAGMFMWISYGVLLNLVPVIIWNVIGAVLIVILIYAKLKYGK